MDPREPLELDPGWRRAERLFFIEGFAPGGVLPIAWLEFNLGAPHCEEGSHKEHQRAALRWLTQFDRFKRAMLNQHQIAFERDRRTDGYRILTGSEHLRFAREESQRRMLQAVQFRRDHLTNIQVDALSVNEQTTLADDLAHLAALQAFLRPKRLPPPATQPKGDDTP